MVDPSRRYQGSFVVNPMWANWVPASIGTGVPPPHRSADVDAGDRAPSWRSVNIAPLGCPVVPEVNTTHDRAVGVGRQLGPVPPVAVRDESLDLVGATR